MDMKRLFGRRAVLGGLSAAGGLATMGWLLAGRAGATITGEGADGATCVQPPPETAGPFPADGSNARGRQVLNVLTEAGVERQDLRGGFAGMEGQAEGVDLALEIRLVDVASACAPLAGLAVYLWHCDAVGRYSLYDLPDTNYLRGLQVSGADGVARFRTIFPGCYPGRWPHMHFEVFASREAAVAGKAALLTSQFALPGEVAATIYGSLPEYRDSLAHLDRVTMRSDSVFRNNAPAEIAAQTIRLSGEPGQGLEGRVVVGIRA